MVARLKRQAKQLKLQRRLVEQPIRRLNTQLGWLLVRRLRQLVGLKLMLPRQQRRLRRLLVHRKMLLLRSLVRLRVLRSHIMEAMHMMRARRRRQHAKQLGDHRKLKKKLLSMPSMMHLRLCFMTPPTLLMKLPMPRKQLGRVNMRSGLLLLKLLRKLSWLLVGLLRKQHTQRTKLLSLLVIHLKKLQRQQGRQLGMLCFMLEDLQQMLQRQQELHARLREDLWKLKVMLLVRQ